LKRAVVVLAVIALVALAGAASAHMWGWGGGPGMMQGWGPGYSGEDKKLLDETADLRRELHAKKFDLAEAYRSGDSEKAEALRGEVSKLQGQLAEKLGPRFGGYGRGYARGGGWNCPGPYGGAQGPGGWNCPGPGAQGPGGCPGPY